MLGVSIDPDYEEQLRITMESKRRQKQKRKEKRLEELHSESPYGTYGLDYDDNYAYIAGFTSGGFPYGITWEEMEKIEEMENRNPVSSSDTQTLYDDDFYF